MDSIMATSSGKSSSNKKKKRKLTSPEDKPRPPKKYHIGKPEKEKEVLGVSESSKQSELDRIVEVGRSWKNLQLILSLQSKEIDLQKKIELAFNYVNTREGEGEEDYETVQVSRLVVFLNDWVQSLLISTDKKVVAESGVIETCLDYRCWLIFKYCLEESVRLQVSLTFSRNLLRAFSCVSRNALSLITEMRFGSKDLVFIGEEFELYSLVLDCVSMVFSSHGGLSNENLDLWISTVRAVLELVHKIFFENLVGGNAGAFALRFSCLVLEPFARFLRVHPPRKNGFHEFVDELLGFLLYLLGMLHGQFDGSNAGCTRKLLTIVEEVLSQGLFHSIHIDGFLSLHSARKYSSSNDGKMKPTKTVIKSYHRHLFDKLEWIIASKKESELNGLGELFHLFVDRVKNNKAASMLSEETKLSEEIERSKHLAAHSSKVVHHISSVPTEISYNSSNLTDEKRESLLDFFVQIMEPLLVEINGYLETKLEVGPLLLDAHCTLKSINHLLGSLFQEKLYLKTADISGRAFRNFLKKVYNTVLSFSTKSLCLSASDSDNQTQEILILVAKQFFVTAQNFLDIEYEVIENDLTSLWLMALSYLALGYYFKDVSDHCSLTAQILGFASQLVKLYSELRQVESAIFALCKAIRLIITRENNSGDRQIYGWFRSCISCLPYETYAKSVGMLLCAQEFKLTIHNGIKSIPEGQAGECIRLLSIDLMESMEWIKSCSAADGMELLESQEGSSKMLYFDLQAELFGRGLSEMYAMVMESLTVTVGNSSLLGRSIEDLITVIRPCMSILAGQQPDSAYDFLSYITGKTTDKGPDGNKLDMLNFGVSTHWVFVFFFRLYISCRSLYRQAITLMPPDTSKKMSEVMRDSFTAYSGRDSIERTEWKTEGYFSWIVRPSASLCVIIQSVSDICLQGSNADCSSLIYVLHAMALQRLVDLNRQIKSLEYILQIQVKLLGDTSLSEYCKRSRKWGRCLSNIREEGESLTQFILSYLSLLGSDRVSDCTTADETGLATYGQAFDESEKWDFSICSVNNKSLLTAIWWIVCQNIDIWSIHASKKMLKIFLSHVICTCLPSITRSFTDGENSQADEAGFLRKITMHHISSELLNNPILYEHKFVCRHLASSFCHLLKKSVLPLFSDFSIEDVDLNSSPHWQEVLSAVGSLPVAVPGSKTVTFHKLSEGRPISHSLHKTPADFSTELKDKKFTSCQSLLSFLCWMPKGYMNSRSFARYVTFLLNLERNVISSLLEFQDASSSCKQYELLKLLFSCRRALKYLTMVFSEEKTRITASSVIPVLSEGSFPMLWLFKSVFLVVGLQETLSEDDADEIREMMFSFLDHTSYIFLKLSEYHFTFALHSAFGKEPHEVQPNTNIAQEYDALNESDPCLGSLENNEAWKSILLMAQSLTQNMQGLLISLKGSLINEKAENDVNVNLNKLSSIASCMSGFLWGLSYGLNHSNATDNDKVKLGLNFEPNIGLCINVFADFLNFVSHMLFVEVGHQPRCSFDDQNFLSPSDCSCLSVSRQISDKGSCHTVTLGGAQDQKLRAAENCSTSLNTDDNFWSIHRNSSQLEESTSVGSITCHCRKNGLFQGLLKGDNPEAAILIRQLLMASSALLKLNLQSNDSSSLSSLIANCFGLSKILLLKFADVSEVPQPFSFICLDGVIKYLEELGNFPGNHTLDENMYGRLVELYLNALGKCISLQGKEATLASHETESSTKKLCSNKGSSETSFSRMSLFLNSFKSRLRMSFKVLISKSSEFHMLLEAIKKELMGVHKGCRTICKINTGSADGGSVSSTVAAGIDCLDLVLEYTSA
ncbi:uncharacterized protein LOC105643786 isoform X2 [Jatropha curcas]|uniref:uncharacterized protein LOC105643786 isoform X2 n=1 Tax=Jatropha curcas TaxID=180498 RepID=UPI001895F596|nr:uncharacterized protein LOC105643786 isoform X2 [Jatropha curcas]